MSFETPILFLIFNRPDSTRKVFEKIREIKPKYLFVAADGPRADNEGEKEVCDFTREIATSVDWNCELKTLFRNNNLGCGLGVSSAITWFFENVEEGIVLEDDCLPSADFFAFSEFMLNLYRNDERIMLVSGTNPLGLWKSITQSYHFSFYGGIWGWASWRRAWQFYDFDMKLWGNPEVQDRLKDVLVHPAEYKSRKEIFDLYFKKEGADTWDYQWSFARVVQSGLSIVPSVNLISNIGFGADATHTLEENSPLSNLKVLPLNFPITINQYVMVDRDYDREFISMHGVNHGKKNYSKVFLFLDFLIGIRPHIIKFLKRFNILLF